MAQIVPIGTSPNQSTRVSLTVDSKPLTLNLAVSFNASAGWWWLGIADQFGNALVSCVPLVTGDYPSANVLAPYSYMQIGSLYVINQSGSSLDWPDVSTLGTGFVLLWDDTAN